MPLPLAGLADALRAAGLTVRELSGWNTRGQNDGPFTPLGVMWHHDASAPGDSPGVPAMMANLANNGAQTWVDRYGVWHLVAAGRMWHAGSGGGWGRIPAGAGNTYSVGVETDHTTGEAWPAAQVSSLRRGTAVLLRLLGAKAGDALCGHKEYRTSNPDPDGLSMADERRAVAALMTNPQQEDNMAGSDDFSDAEEDRVLAAAGKQLDDYRVTDGGPGDVRPDDYPLDRPDDQLGHVMTMRAWQQRHIALSRLINSAVARLETAATADTAANVRIEASLARIEAALTSLAVGGQTQAGFDALYRTSALTTDVLREGAVYVDNDPPRPPSQSV